MKVLFLDESGDHNLMKIDPEYPVFVLGGVLLERSYARTVVAPRMRELKRYFFGNEDVVLHTSEIIRQRNVFAVLKNSSFRQEFFTALNVMMRQLEYTVIACAIRKPQHRDRYGVDASDPYMYSLEVLVERFWHEIGNVAEGGIIHAEKRGASLDRQLERAWIALQDRGTDDVPADHLNTRIVDLVLREKELNLAGLQLADLVVSPIGRRLIGKASREDWEIVESKLSRFSPDGSYLDIGLTVLP